MTIETKHTPTPWELHPDNTSIVRTDDIGGSAACLGQNSIANAEFIVRACNAHDDLLAALEVAQACMAAECKDTSYLNAKQTVREALAKAKAGA